MANVLKDWRGTTSFKVTGGTEYTFTARDALAIADADHRAQLMLRGLFTEAAGALTFVADKHIQGDDGTLWQVDASGQVTVDDTNIANLPVGEVEDPA